MTKRSRPGYRPGADPAKVVKRFIAAVNRGDVNALVGLMAKDHLLVDSLGSRVRGRRAVGRAWAGYFAMAPGYRIAVGKTMVAGRTVVILGTAAGSYVSLDGTMQGEWQVPAAWRAVSQRGRIGEWQIYADNEPIRALMRKASKNAV